MRLYRFLLHLYPSSFRAAYGEEMQSIFNLRRREAAGAFAVAGLWLGAFFEILANAAAAHWDILRQDLRYTIRALRRAPGFALAAVLVVALGVGANTAAFSVADFVLIRPLPFADPSRLVKIWERLPGYSRQELSPADYRDWKRMSSGFETMGASRGLAVNMIGQGDPQHLEGAALTAEMLPMLGVQPVIGRIFTTEEDRYGAQPTLLLSYRLWQSEFGGDSGVLGRRVRLDDKSYVIIGVMPPNFHFPRREADLWAPMQFQEADFEDRNNNYLHVFARLKPGVSLDQARAGLAVVTAQLQRQYPKENGKTEANIYFLRDDISPRSRLLLLALMGAAGCVLLIACANLMNLLLARSLARQRELAVRSAMGAGWKRLTRQMLTESLVLAFAGAALGVALAITAVPLFAKLVPDSLPIATTPTVDLRVLAFSALLAALTGIGFGLLPALRACRNVDLGGLREGSRSGGRKERLRSTLVVIEMASSVVLLISAGLLIRALWRIQAIDPGFRTEGVLTMRTALPMPKYEKTATREEFYQHVLASVRQLPGVSNAAYISFLPMAMRGGIWPVSVNGEPLDNSVQHNASARFLTPGFFAAMGIPMLMGRDVSESDTMDRPFATVVSASFIKRYWPNDGNPLGKHFTFGNHDRVVVGVVADIHVRGLEQSSEPQVYMAYKQISDGWFPWYAPKDLVIQSTASPAALLPAIRRIVHEADPEQPIAGVQSMSEIVADETATRSLQVTVLSIFAFVAFLLAGVGIHGLLSFAVSQRTQEIGVRIALGAQRGNIMRLVLGRSARLAALGIAAGLALAYASGRTMESLLAGVKPGDPATFAIAVALCLLMALLGSLSPTVKAVKVDPIAAIRME